MAEMAVGLGVQGSSVRPGVSSDPFAKTLIAPSGPEFESTVIIPPEKGPEFNETVIVPPEKLHAQDESDVAKRQVSRPPVMPHLDLYDPNTGMRYLGGLKKEDCNASETILSTMFDVNQDNPALVKFKAVGLEDQNGLAKGFFAYKAGQNIACTERFEELGKKVFGDLLKSDQDQAAQIIRLLESVLIPRVQAKIAALTAVDPLGPEIQNFAVLAVPRREEGFDPILLKNFPFFGKDLEIFGEDFVAKVLTPALGSVLKSIYFSSSPLLSGLQEKAAEFRDQREEFIRELRSSPEQNETVLEYLRNFNLALSAKAQGRDPQASVSRYCAEKLEEFAAALGSKFDKFFVEPCNRSEVYLFLGQWIIARNKDLVQPRISPDLAQRNKEILTRPADDTRGKGWVRRGVAGVGALAALGLATSSTSSFFADRPGKPPIAVVDLVQEQPLHVPTAQPTTIAVSQQEAVPTPREIKFVEHKGKALLVSEIKAEGFGKGVELSDEAKAEAELIKSLIINLDGTYDTDKVIFVSEADLRTSVEALKTQPITKGDETTARQVALGRACANSITSSGTSIGDFKWFRHCEYPWTNPNWSITIARNPYGGQAIFINTEKVHLVSPPARGPLTAQVTNK